MNPGIRDLDPHQKGVLADDIGVAIALGLLDQTHGIVGIDDVYRLHAAGFLSLKSRGRHRRMPDFVLELRRPISRSRFVLLECKGSTTPGQYSSQLTTACDNQLDNVDTLHGSNARLIPKIAAATELLLGGQASIYLDDPRETLEPLGDKLRANLLALEYSLFGDLLSANEVWKAYGMPVFSAAQVSPPLPSDASSTVKDEAVAELIRPEKLESKAVGQFEELASDRIGYASTRISLKMTPEAEAARASRDWAMAISKRRTIAISSESVSESVADQDDGGQRRIEEFAVTSSGIKATAVTQVWFA